VSGQQQLQPTRQLRAHEHSSLVPDLDGCAYAALRDDIADRGLLQPLEITSKGIVLDGRQRLRAATELGHATVPVLLVEPADELEHIILAALQRRHLSASQRAALAVELDRYQQLRSEAVGRQRANLRQHADTEAAFLPPRGKSRDQAAAWAGVSARTIQDAATVRGHDPVLFERVKAGEIAAAVAARRVRRQHRDARLVSAPLPEGPFQLIYADPPWQLGNPDGANAPENHYPTMPLHEIKELHVPAADDALLLLWAVNCLLPEALEVVAAWGFGYKTSLVWVKPSIGLGNWTRNRHEQLLLATRGKVALPEPADRPDSVIEAERGRHSQKPDAVYQLIEKAWPALSKLELFARSPRLGWQAWGNQLAA
jgi:N6-adenosine-specific RNA methylase IME4